MLTKKAPILTHDVNVSPYDEGYKKCTLECEKTPRLGIHGLQA